MKEQGTTITAEPVFLATLINLCDDLAWGRPCNEDVLFALTREGSAPAYLVRLAEAFGMMVVKVETREYHLNQLIEDLKKQNTELQQARAILEERHQLLVSSVQEEYNTKRVVGQCESMRRVIQMALSIARRPINTLVLGPTGAGKEVIAKTIHFNSPRREAPFVAVNCTAIPDSLFESEMFGIEKGIATGVVARKGLFEEANDGTLFLDELADMSLPNQAKLLRVLEEHEVMRVGSNKPIPVDVKVVAATNVNLEEAVKKGRFREDLFYRINVAEIHLPPLSERGDDILLLATVFLERHCASMGRPRLRLSYDVRQCLQQYSWPGNVRELNNEMERAAALTLSDVVERKDLSPRLLDSLPAALRQELDTAATYRAALTTDSSGGSGEKSTENPTSQPAPRAPQHSLNLEEMERNMVYQALRMADGNKSKASELLGITREGLRKKLLRMEKDVKVSA